MAVLSWVASNVILACLLGMTAFFVQRCLRDPAVAHFLWVLALVKLLTPPLVEVPLFDARKSARDVESCSCGSPTATDAGSAWASALIGTWLAGAAVCAFVGWRRWLQFQHFLAEAVPAPDNLRSAAKRLTVDLKLRREPEFLVTSVRVPPFVLPGWRCAKLVAPATILDELSREQRDSLLMHELTHVKRGDHFVRVLESVVGAVYWWLPGRGWVGRQLRTCEEACCDAAVVSRRPKARREYARLLLNVIDIAAPIRTSGVTAMNAAGQLERRLRTILNPPTHLRRRWLPSLIAVLALAATPFEIRFDGNSIFQDSSAAASAAPAVRLGGAQHFESPLQKTGCCAS